MNDLAHALHLIGLRYCSDQLDDLLAHATQKRLSPRQLLERITELEQKDRARRSLERRTARSKLGRFKPIADFDWNWPKKISRDAVQSALSLDFIAAAKNIILIAPQGLGKTMIAKNIAHHAVLAGYCTLFISAADLLLDLSTLESARALDQRLKHYASFSCLCIDEVGYLSYDQRNADLLFRIVSMRYETKSLVLTTNLPFSDWPCIFPGAACTTALIDRVIHHAEILTIEGDSYRLREAKARTPARSHKP